MPQWGDWDRPRACRGARWRGSGPWPQGYWTRSRRHSAAIGIDPSPAGAMRAGARPCRNGEYGGRAGQLRTGALNRPRPLRCASRSESCTGRPNAEPALSLPRMCQLTARGGWGGKASGSARALKSAASIGRQRSACWREGAAPVCQKLEIFEPALDAHALQAEPPRSRAVVPRCTAAARSGSAFLAQRPRVRHRVARARPGDPLRAAAVRRSGAALSSYRIFK